jgi:outer membrane protein assembly factor BamB
VIASGGKERVMTRRVLMSCVVLALTVTTARAEIPYSRDLLPTRSALARVGLERHWMAVVPLHTTERVIELSMAGSLVFAQTNQANFFTFDAESGRLLWSATLGHESGDVQPASANSRLVFVTNSNMLFALDRHTGRRVWRENLAVLPTSPTACDEDHIVVGLNTGMIRGFDLRVHDDKGNVKKYENGQTVLAPQANFAWNWQTGGPLTSRPLVAGPLVAFGGHDARAYVAATETPTMLYRIATGGEIFAALSTHGTRTLLVPSADKNVYAVDIFTSSILWSFASGAPVMQEAVVADNDVFVTNTAGVLSAVDALSGLAKWSISTHGGRLTAISPSRLYMESHDEDLFIVDRLTGKVLADPRATHDRAGLNLRAYNLGIVNSTNDRIYVGTKSGLFLCLREIGQVQPRPLRNPKEKPFGYIPPEGLPDTKTPPAAPPADAGAPKEETPPPGEEKEAPKEEPAPKEEAAPK